MGYITEDEVESLRPSFNHVAALLSLLFFGSVLGDGTSNVIGFGTLILAIFIGLLMKLTDPLIAAVLRLFKRN